MKEKLKKAWKWLRTHILNKEMIVPGILGELTYWSPLIATGFLALLVDPKYWTVFGAIYSFWVFLLPAIPIQLAFIAFFKLIINFLRGKQND